jgi:hypothetical protein
MYVLGKKLGTTNVAGLRRLEGARRRDRDRGLTAQTP